MAYPLTFPAQPPAGQPASNRRWNTLQSDPSRFATERHSRSQGQSPKIAAEQSVSLWFLSTLSEDEVRDTGSKTGMS
jgi:hypothetical protein